MKQTEDAYTRDMFASRNVQMPRSGRGPYRGDDGKTFGAYIAQMRRNRHMTQLQYAELVEASRRSLIMVEQLIQFPKVIPYHSTLFKIASKEFGCSFHGPRAQMRQGFDEWRNSTT